MKQEHVEISEDGQDVKLVQETRVCAYLNSPVGDAT